MTDAQTWRIQQLEKQVEDLKEEVREITSLRDQILGMSNAAKWGFRLLVLLAGTGGITVVHWILKWLNAPIGAAK